MISRFMTLAAVVAALSGPVCADDAEDAFVEANLLGIFYHELGHAMIDLMQLPVFGQEEDAADVASILLIDALFEPETALALAYDAAFGFAAEAMLREDEEYEIAWWDSHGPDEQRFYNTVCIFYGADPDLRDDFAEDMGLPEERADICIEEFELAWDSWGPVIDELAESDGDPLVYWTDEDSFLADLMASEVEELNQIFLWPEELEVVVEACGEANAFYDPLIPAVIMCAEFEPHLRRLYDLTE
jgi:hypothetical protein